MQRSNSFLLTVGLAVFVAVVLWIWQRDDPATPAAPSGSTASTPEHPPVAGAAIERPSDRSSAEDPANLQKPKQGLPKPKPAPVVRPEDLPAEIKKARVEAFRGWQDKAHQQLMTCLPPWTEAGAPRAVRVHFRPEPSTADASSPEVSPASQLRPDTVAPLDPTLEVPGQVRQCLDRLLDTTLELPREAPESQHGHQEIIHVMWG